MADLDSRLTTLVDPPLGPIPPLDAIGDRASRVRRRRRGVVGIAGGLVVLAIVGVAAAMPDGGQTLKTQGPARAATPAPATGTKANAVVVGRLNVGGVIWELSAWIHNETQCLQLGTDPTRASCSWATTAKSPVAIGALTVGSDQFLYGAVDKSVDKLRIEMNSGTTTEVPVLGRDAGFAVNFYAHHVVTGMEIGDLVASLIDGTERRLQNVLSIPTGPPPQVSVALPPPPGVAPVPVTTAPTPAATEPGSSPSAPAIVGVPAPVITLPIPIPGGGMPQLVKPVLGALGLHAIRFESAVAAPGNGTGNQLSVRFWSGVAPCSVLGDVKVVETSSTVTVTLMAGTAPGSGNVVCAALAAYYEVLVPLSAPVGSRVIVDGAA